jgi:hypothetical protein
MTPKYTQHTRPAAALAPESAWFTSSYSTQDGGNCVEVAGLATHVAVRDSKDKGGSALVVSAAAWAAFIGEVVSA